VGLESVKAFERVAGRWIAANRTLAGQVGKPAPILRHSLKLTPRSSFEEAMAAGERFVADFHLGVIPAEMLPEVMESQLGILVLMVDAIEGVSGAACRLPDLDAVLINRHEIIGRRNFDLAHELFHILTWDTMAPDYLEDATETSKVRVEQLANNFASALLMPEERLKSFDPASARDEMVRWLNSTADHLEITATALKWRLVALKRLDPARAKEISDETLRYNGRKSPESKLPPLFSKSFMQVLGQAINEGRISARRAANLLDLSIEDLGELFTQHAVEAPLNL
jgi:Zn-dependent peptidase ImmA (M78 family)